MLESERICRVAVDEQGRLMGIIGGIPAYDGHVWELHPLAGSAVFAGTGHRQGAGGGFRGTGSRQGRLTITLGSDDEDNMTSLSGVDLYENLWEKIRDIRNLKSHPFGFYQRMGYIITGVVPDANGIGQAGYLDGEESQLMSLRGGVPLPKQSPL